MKNVYYFSAACGLLAIIVAGCGGSNNGPTNPTATPNPTTGATPVATFSPNQTFAQTDRLARPVVNEVLATFANNRHLVNDTDNPTDDSSQLANDIQSFMTFPAGRSQATTNVVKAVLVPDVMVADLSQSGPAAYLGSETGGATGGKYGGRKLTDDVVDTSLGVIFGNTVSSLGLAPDDGKEIPTLTSDNVGPGAKNYSSTFPYLGAPK
ncbi:hypothetical protein IAD21_01167 [Abditibacteriota bacterium]|nr:hypothetical protein IAD21_01167 [Abditibacteriota bacterium]